MVVVKRRLVWTVLALAVPGLAAVAAVRSSIARSYDRPYQRAMRRTLDDAQERLAESVDLYQDRSTWENPWVITTRRYEVRTTESFAFGNRIAQGLEVMFGEFQRTLGSDWEPSAPLKVFVFPNLTAYNAFGEEHGAEHSSFYGSFYAADHPERPVATYYCGNDTRQNQWVTHSAAHQFVAGAFPGQTLQDSVSEGIAAYFALYYDFKGALQRFDALRSPDSMGEVRFIPLDNLLQTPMAQYGDRPGDRLVELGVLSSYLLNYREDTRTQYDDSGAEIRAPFAEYIRTALSGGDPTALPIHMLVTQDTGYLEDELRAFEFE